jgi:GntR family transcriptional repressor for pyruvate dehydrogenase complex
LSLSPIQNITVTEAIIEKLETMIVEGVFKPGDTLPPERKLAKEFGVSRASLRQALAALEIRSLITSRQGGGHYVCDVVKNSFSDPLVSLLNRHTQLKFQIVEVRQILEGAAAYYAAERATDQDRVLIQKRFESLQAILPNSTPVEEAKADLDLHLAIADAAHNAPLTLMLRNIYALLLKHIEEHLSLISDQDITNQRLQAQHTDLVSAVLASDGERARRIMQEHLEFVSDSFRNSGLVAKRKQTAEMRAYLSDG